MGRKVVRNFITTPERKEQICEFNKDLRDGFLEYLSSVDRSQTTIIKYTDYLNVFFVYNLMFNGNKKFTEITKREFLKFQNYALNEWNWSSAHMRCVKSCLSSLSNYIENMLDDDPEFAGYKSVIKKIENPAPHAVLEKTVFSDEELQSLLDHLVSKKKYRQACCLALCMASGRRRSELPRFKVEYFDDKNLLYNALWKTPEKVQTKGRGKHGKPLDVYVIKSVFKPYFDLWMKFREENGIQSEWLFPNMKDYSVHMTVNAMIQWANSFSNFLGKPFYWHSIRHYYTTNLLKHDIPATVVQEIVGWSDISMIQKYNDSKLDDELHKYFDENGVKHIESGKLSDL